MAVLNKYIFQFRRYSFNLPKVNNSLSQRTESYLNMDYISHLNVSDTLHAHTHTTYTPFAL